MQTIKIDKVTDVKQGQYGLSSRIWQGRDMFIVNEDATALIGKTVEAEVIEKTGSQGGKYKVAKNVKVIETAPVENNHASNGKVPWAEAAMAAKAFHALALDLEPDTLNQMGINDPTISIDRSTARAAILNTMMIAFTNGKLAAPEIEETPFD